jgi:hypothetical protein
MKKSIFLLGAAVIFLASCDVRKKDKVAVDNQPTQQLVIKDPTTVRIIDTAYSFGTIAEGDIVTYNFRFVNTGKNPLIISNASASCGCTVPEKPEKPILTGDTGFIKVKFNSDHKVGPVNKNVTVSSNAEPAFPYLVIKGEVKPKKEK